MSHACRALVDAVADKMIEGGTDRVPLDALSLTFTATCQSAGLDPHELIARSRRQLREAAATRNPEIEAICAYTTGELL